MKITEVASNDSCNFDGFPNQDDRISKGKMKIKYEITNKINKDIKALIIFFTFIKIKKHQSCRYDYYYSNIIIQSRQLSKNNPA